jgi:hypothetical protein
MFCEVVQRSFEATERLAIIAIVKPRENSCIAKKLAYL